MDYQREAVMRRAVAGAQLRSAAAVLAGALEGNGVEDARRIHSASPRKAHLAVAAVFRRVYGVGKRLVSRTLQECAEAAREIGSAAFGSGGGEGDAVAPNRAHPPSRRLVAAVGSSELRDPARDVAVAAPVADAAQFRRPEGAQGPVQLVVGLRLPLHEAVAVVVRPAEDVGGHVHGNAAKEAAVRIDVKGAGRSSLRRLRHPAPFSLVSGSCAAERGM